MLYRVHAKREAGFRRAGRFWPAAPPALVDLDEATAAILLAEPMLDVRPARGEDLASAAPAGESIESMRSKIAALEAELSSARSASEQNATALKAAQEACAKLREENKLLKSKKSPAEAPAEKSAEKPAESDAKAS